jgi:PIN domain nuclease of toxin-antitoxin system
MAAVAVDTHAIIWYLSNDQRLSVKAAEALDLATGAGDVIYVPSICLVELTYLVEKGRLPSVARDRLIKALDDPATACNWRLLTGWLQMRWNLSTVTRFRTYPTAS